MKLKLSRMAQAVNHRSVNDRISPKMSTYGNGPASSMVPELQPWMRQLLIGLFGLYAVELLAGNVGFSFATFVWRPFGYGFAPYQLLTRFLVQGGEVFGVLISLLVLYFFLPAIDRIYTRQQLIQCFVCAVVAGSALGLIGDGLGLLVPSPAMGWSVLIMPLVVLFGLGMPNGVVQLFFVLPIRAIWFVWAAIAIASLSFLAHPALTTADAVGSWLGVMGWYHYLGPGRRRRELTRHAASIERDLRRFQVFEGGKQDPDDWVH
jgi:hypothetical protein